MKRQAEAEAGALVQDLANQHSNPLSQTDRAGADGGRNDADKFDIIEAKESGRVGVETQQPAAASQRHFVVALVSGGKDSIYAMMEAMRIGHTIVCVANLHPADENDEDVDSWTYQTIGHGVVPAVAEALQLPLVRAPISGSSVNTELNYTRTDGDEVEDLFKLIQLVLARFPHVTAVLSGAVLSNYQRTRVEDVCMRLGLTPMAFLWQRDQRELVEEMLDAGVKATIAKVACIGLGRRHIGRQLEAVLPDLLTLHDSFGVHVAGEGGEYETLTVDAPIYHSKIVLDDAVTVAADAAGEDDGGGAPVLLLQVRGFHLEPKPGGTMQLAATQPREAVLPTACAASVTNLPSSNIEVAFRSSVCFSRTSGRGYATLVGPRFPGIVGGKAPPDAQVVLSAAFEELGRMLRQHELGFEHVVHIRVGLRELRDFALLNSVFAEHFGRESGVLVPSRSCVAMTMAGTDSVTLRCVLQVDSGAKQPTGCGGGDRNDRKRQSGGLGQTTIVHRSVLHVRSISRWAPVCIGPYSQSNQLVVQQGGESTVTGMSTAQEVREVYLAGQIALVPETMDMCGGGWQAELHQAVRNVAAVLQCSGSDIALVSECRVFVAVSLLSHIGEGASELSPVQRDALPFGIDSLRSELRASFGSSRRMQFPSFNEGVAPDLASGEIKSSHDWPGLTTVLVVDALPRNALIEIEVVAAGLASRPWKLARERSETGYGVKCSASQTEMGGVRFAVQDLKVPVVSSKISCQVTSGYFIGGTDDSTKGQSSRRFLSAIYATVLCNSGALHRHWDPADDVRSICGSIVSAFLSANGFCRILHVDITIGRIPESTWRECGSQDLHERVESAVVLGCREALKPLSRKGATKGSSTAADHDDRYQLSTCVSMQSVPAPEAYLEQWMLHLRFHPEP
eukprot:INCI17830.1.p1 GENE.INCI17830.1~~INCI17830.1.p1  ORF type:complete len:953 (+),score=139.74 INCI17830.1:139-2859(+)